MRQHVLPWVEMWTGHEATATLYEQEFVGVIGGGLDGSISELESIGYDYQELAGVKYHPVTGDTDDGSFARVDPDKPRWQWHVHLFDRGGRVEVAVHYELRPEPTPIGDESWQDVRERLEGHYDPPLIYHHPSGAHIDALDIAAQCTGVLDDRLGEVVR
jgi:hypothetical protein